VAGLALRSATGATSGRPAIGPLTTRQAVVIAYESGFVVPDDPPGPVTRNIVA
jgi:hypothetical protein